MTPTFIAQLSSQSKFGCTFVKRPFIERNREISILILQITHDAKGWHLNTTKFLKDL